MKLYSRNMKANYLKFNTFQHYSSLDKKWRGCKNWLLFNVENSRKLRKKHILKIIYILGGVLQKAKLNIAKKYALNRLKYRSKKK